AEFAAKTARGYVGGPFRWTVALTMTPSAFTGEKLPAHEPCSTMSPISRRLMSYFFARGSAIGANIATAAGPNAPAVVGIAATKNMTHGISAVRPPTSRASEFTNHSIVPFTEAIPKR